MRIVYHIMASSKHLIVGNSNEEINQLIQHESSTLVDFSCHYNAGEEMFLKFERPLTVPSMPIHHDVRNPVAGKQYSQNIAQAVQEILLSVPGLVNGMKYYFDPSDVHRPTFYQLYKIQETNYIYQLKIDLTYNPSYHEVIEAGSNDYGPKFQTKRLIVEADIIPIAEITRINGFPTLHIEQSISDTWIGETGRGYFVQGIWLDRELTKFFSKLFLPLEKRMYPYYPISCKYQAICQTLNVFTPAARRKRLAAHHNIRRFLLKYLEGIETALRHGEFNENMDAFQAIRQKVPEVLHKIWEPISVEVYLNENEMREYRIRDQFN